MTLTDIVLLAALGVFLAAWWVRATPARPVVLTATAGVALVAGVAGMLDYRWQAAVGVCVAAVLLLVLGVNRLRRAPVKPGVPFVSGVVFAVLSLAAGGLLALFPVDPLPKPDGPYAVGVRTFELTDASRTGVLGAAPDEPRRLLARVWYPAASVDGLKARPYFDAGEAKSTARGLGDLVGFPAFMTHLKHVRTNSYEGAQVRLPDGGRKYPVILYSHGYTSFLGQNTVLMETLASHGYVVVSVQHTYDSSPTPFADGSVIPMSPAIAEMAKEPPSEAQRKALGGATLDERLEGTIDGALESFRKKDRISTESAVAWVADRLFLHDQLQSRNLPADIADIVLVSDLDGVGEIGMSFGGATAGSICMIDRRCVAGVNLDGGDFHYLAFDAKMPVPFLMFHSDADLLYGQVGVDAGTKRRPFNGFSYERIATAGLDPGVYRVTLRGAHHLGLSDFGLFVRRPLRDSLFGPAPGNVMTGAQDDFVLGFFDRHLKGEANGFPAPQLAARDGWVSRADVSEIAAWWAGKPAEEQARLAVRVAESKAAAPLAKFLSQPAAVEQPAP
jgi:predicted dienelactone hydrolase